jgi:hypothetical protein
LTGFNYVSNIGSAAIDPPLLTAINVISNLDNMSSNLSFVSQDVMEAKSLALKATQNLTISIPSPKESNFEDPIEEYVEERENYGENDWLTTMSSLTVIEQRRRMALDAFNH